VADSYNLAAGNPWEIAGGTSLSAPSWAALLALANQGRAEAGRATLGSAGPTEAQAALYGLGQDAFHDVTTGSNGYLAGIGYDLATGLGTPVADVLIPGLAAYDGGPASSTPVAPIAASGLELSADAGHGVGGMDALARAALRVFAARVVTHTPASVLGASADAEPARAVPHSSSAGAVPVAANGDGAGHHTPTEAIARPASWASVSLTFSAPEPANSVPTGGWRSESPAGWAALLDTSSVPGHGPAAAGALRPEMSASGGSDVLVGGAGDDLLVGGAGRDLLIGGYAARHGAPTSQQDGTLAEGLPGPAQAAWDAPEETSSPGDGQ
jgi:hypothetical protein